MRDAWFHVRVSASRFYYGVCVTERRPRSIPGLFNSVEEENKSRVCGRCGSGWHLVGKAGEGSIPPHHSSVIRFT